MHSRIQEVVDYLAGTRADLENAVEAVPDGQRNTRSSHDCWSVAEILEHLNIIESRVGSLLATNISAAKAAGIGPEVETSAVLSTIDTARIGDRSKRVTAPDIVKPRAELDAATAGAALRQSREKLVAALMSGDGLALSELKFEHPVLGLIDLYQWAIFVGAHEARHTKQVLEISQPTGS